MNPDHAAAVRDLAVVNLDLGRPRHLDHGDVAPGWPGNGSRGMGSVPWQQQDIGAVGIERAAEGRQLGHGARRGCIVADQDLGGDEPGEVRRGSCREGRGAVRAPG